MSNRAQRRSAVKYFRRRCGKDLITTLTDDLALINTDPALKAALAYWLSVVELRRPICISCKVSFVDGNAEPVGFFS